MSARRRRPQCERGATLVEVLVAMLVTVFGLLGVAALQLRTAVAETESYQRAQAQILLDDMVGRLQSNRAEATDYVGVDIGTGPMQDCADEAGAALDLCEWGNLLRGAAEAAGERAVGAMAVARGCVIETAPRTYVVAVVWQGSMSTGGPRTECGAGAYEDDTLRRAVTALVRFADLG